jgi:hypothetical protein
MVAVAIMRVVQVTIDDVVGVVAVLDRLVPTALAVHVTVDMLTARMRHAAGWIHRIDLDHLESPVARFNARAGAKICSSLSARSDRLARRANPQLRPANDFPRPVGCSMFTCDACKAKTLAIVLAVDIEPDDDSDEARGQILRCTACAAGALGYYEESRRGSGESWHHWAYLVGDDVIATAETALRGKPRLTSAAFRALAGGATSFNLVR